MSLPTSSSSGKLSQSSLRSFFQPKSPSYVAPPSQATSAKSPPATTDTFVPPAPPPPPPPPTTTITQHAAPEPSTAQPPARNGPSNINIPFEASIRRIHPDDVKALSRINALLLPVSYPDAFYQRAIDPTTSGPFSRVITWTYPGEQPKVIGGVVCRVEQALEAKGTTPGSLMPWNLYIQSLCLLSPFRGKGLINAALEDILATAEADPNLLLVAVTAHVWSENDEGLKWYEARGFTRDPALIQGYYPRLRPGTAWLVRRRVSPVTAAISSFQTATATAAPIPSPMSPTGLPPSSSSTSLSTVPQQTGDRLPPFSRTSSTQSYQKQRAETEWNDLPADMAPSPLAALRQTGSEPASGTNSRSSSAARKKKDRSYPAAAFGK